MVLRQFRSGGVGRRQEGGVKKMMPDDVMEDMWAEREKDMWAEREKEANDLAQPDDGKKEDEHKNV